MNHILFLLAAGVAIGIFVLARRYLKWQPMLWLGVLLTGTAGAVLLLDHLTDIVESVAVGERTATGIPLFMLGPEISILGKGWPFFFITFLCGIALIVASFIKKAKQPLPQPSEQVEKNFSEIERIENDLKKQIGNVQIDAPAERGEKDASNIGGPIPSRGATEPAGYELEARREYETLGGTFVQRTIARLKEEIESALQTLANIKTALDNRPYAAIAAGDYNENAAVIGDVQVDSMREKVVETEQKYQAFITRLRLQPAEQPDWLAKRTPFKQLLIYGGVFALIEFLVSWYFLQDQLGSNDAVKVAGLAVVVIGLLAFSSAAIFQFMRRGQTIPIRALASAGYACLLLMVFCGFGLLLNFRDDSAKEGIASWFDVVLEGYGSMLTQLDNLTLFLINLFALAFFYWKSLLFFDRFHGYSNVEEPFRAAQRAWEKMFEDNDDNIRAALGYASDKADNNSNNAEKAFSDLQEKKTALENIQPNIEPLYVQHLHRAYRDDIREYRDSNRKHRNHKVHPVPNYFRQDAEFCTVEEHFSDDHGVSEFLAQHEETIEQAGDTRQSIQQTGSEWQNERPLLQDRWTMEFQRKVDDAGQ